MVDYVCNGEVPLHWFTFFCSDVPALTRIRVGFSGFGGLEVAGSLLGDTGDVHGAILDQCLL